MASPFTFSSYPTPTWPNRIDFPKRQAATFPVNAAVLNRLRLSVAVAALFAGPTNADTHYVGVDGNGFSPSELTINVGDTVVWVSDDDTFPHTTTSDLPPSDPDYWNGPLYDYQDTYPKTFNNPGIFTYHDSIDVGTGTITVSAAPSLDITLESPRIESGQFLFEASGLTAGRTNILEVSTNSIQWSAASTNVAAAASMSFTNAVQVQPGATFFRLLEIR